jgi:Protein of unknown function (DUF1302)/AMIN domain
MRFAASLAGVVLVLHSVVSVAEKAGSVLVNVRVGEHFEYSRLVLDLSRPTRYTVLHLSDPQRVRVELANSTTDLTTAGLPRPVLPITDIQLGALDATTVWMEVAVEPGVVVEFFSLKPHLKRGDRLVVDFLPKRTVASKYAPEVEGVEKKPATELLGTVKTGSNLTATSGPLLASQNTPAPKTRVRKSVEMGNVEFSGTWEQEWAVETDGFDSQKFEALIEPRVDIRFPNKTKLTAIGRVRLDSVGDLGPDTGRPGNYSNINGPLYNDAHAEMSVRELYFDMKWGGTYLRIGKQQVVWGEADGIKVLDVVNPQSFREFILDDFDDARIPLSMLKLELPVGEDSTLQFLWIPDPTYHELAELDTPFSLTSPLLVPSVPDGIDIKILEPDKPGDFINDSDIGGRLSAFWGGWDVTLNYLYHYQDFPVLYQDVALLDGVISGFVNPGYERNHLAGGTLSNAFGDFTLRGEIAYNTDTFHISSDLSNRGVANSAEFASVFGLDWRFGMKDTFVSLQWFQSHLLDYESEIQRDRTEHNLSLLYRRTFDNEIWRVDAQTLYSMNREDFWLHLGLSYMFWDNLEVWLGGDIFGGDKEGIFGQFYRQDRVLVGIELGF